MIPCNNGIKLFQGTYETVHTDKKETCRAAQLAA